MLSLKRYSLFMVSVATGALLMGCNQNAATQAPAGFTDYTGHFTSKNNEIKTQSASDYEMSKILNCQEASSVTRLDKKAYSVTYQVSNRQQESFDSPSLQADYQIGYSTSTAESVYESSYTTLGTAVNGQWIVGNSAYAYTDSCTISAGCDVQKRSFTKGSAWEMVKANSEYRKALNQAKQNSGNISCSFSQDPENPTVESVAQEGTYTLGATSYPAVLVTTKRNVNVQCMGMKVTKAVTTLREVIIADLLPQANEFSVSRVGDRNLSCARTRVFVGQVTQSKETTFAGSNNQLNSYVVVGKVLSTDEWNKNQSEYAATLARLEQAVALAQSRKNDSLARFTSARALVSEALTQATNARSEADKAVRDAQVIANDPKSTKEQVEQAREKADAASVYANQKQTVYEQARESAIQAEIAYNQSEESLRQAKEDLRRFKEGIN